jgi:hypothetical protein
VRDAPTEIDLDFNDLAVSNGQAVGGLLAGALVATVFAMHCTNDSPLFVAIWCALAIGLMAMAGLLFGRYVLRW